MKQQKKYINKMDIMMMIPSNEHIKDKTKKRMKTKYI